MNRIDGVKPGVMLQAASISRRTKSLGILGALKSIMVDLYGKPDVEGSTRCPREGTDFANFQ